MHNGSTPPVRCRPTFFKSISSNLALLGEKDDFFIVEHGQGVCGWPGSVLEYFQDLLEGTYTFWRGSCRNSGGGQNRSLGLVGPLFLEPLVNSIKAQGQALCWYRDGGDRSWQSPIELSGAWDDLRGGICFGEDRTFEHG